MAKVTPISNRKSEHININLTKDVRSGLSNGLERFHFIHEALPEINLADIDTTLELFNRYLSAPILISSMTGGTPEAARINQNLAKAAQATKIALGLGSQRAAIDNPDLESTYKVRKYAPDALLFANLGAIQLITHYSIDHCRRAIDMVEADGLILHLNPLQEALQSNGDTNFAGLIDKIESVCKALSVPVIVKEVGWGISKNTALKLYNAGVQAIDVAGAGGTSWSQVEMYRAKDPNRARLAASFIDWGIPTADSILEVKQILPEMTIFASGGIRSGIEIAKCISLGATLGGMASPFLKAAAKSAEDVIQEIANIINEIEITMFVIGAINLGHLKHTRLNKI
jgi:isopentenyl-diphosphate delta-isomerase